MSEKVEVMTPTQAGIQCPGSLLKKFLNPRLRSLNRTFMLAYNGTVINSLIISRGVLLAPACFAFFTFADVKDVPTHV